MYMYMYIIQYNSPQSQVFPAMCVCIYTFLNIVRKVCKIELIQQHCLHWVTSIPPAVYRPGVVVFSDLIVIVWCMGIKCSAIV